MPELADGSLETPSRETRVRGEDVREPAVLSTLKSDDQLFRALLDRFTILADTCTRMSQEVYRWSGTPPETDIEGTVRRNLKIARTVFGGWSIEILATLHLTKSIAFRDLKRALGRISAPVLTAKLRTLEHAGLLQRDAVAKRPGASRYSLTYKGSMVTRLGEPVFLYLRLAGGWRNPASGVEAGEDVENPASPIADEL